ncbi:unnamed protein product [Gemmata massiliana]|uniref:Uncharacterized protein n=1 Tax=Gemmata massiliana TaxID=1210884 RepID=A0A6P2DH57_9BACT|nr:unnamed protein product [Gemmata massiliana]
MQALGFLLGGFLLDESEALTVAVTDVAGSAKTVGKEAVDGKSCWHVIFSHDIAEVDFHY